MIKKIDISTQSGPSARQPVSPSARQPVSPSARPSRAAARLGPNCAAEPVGPDELITLAQVEAHTHLSRSAVRAAIDPAAAAKKGIPTLKVMHLGRSVRVRGSTFLRWLERLEAYQSKAAANKGPGGPRQRAR